MAGAMALVPQLTEKNFAIWDLRLRASLTMLGLSETIEGPSRATAPATSSSVTSGAGVKMVVADASEDEKKAHAFILLRLDDERAMMMQRIATGDAAGLYAHLTRLYVRQTTASKAHTRNMLHQSRMGNDDFDVYKSRVMQHVLRLRGMGEAVSEGELMYVLLEGLPAAYSSLRQSLEVQDDMQFEKMCDHVRDHQEKIAHTADRDSVRKQEDESAMIAQRVRRDDVREQRPESEYRCRLCSKVGHWEQHCTMRRRRGDACFRCGGDGHQMRDCRSRTGGAANEVKETSFSATHHAYGAVAETGGWDYDETVKGY